MSLHSSSSFRHVGQRDDRRRRLLTDELTHSGGASNQVWLGGPTIQKSEHYGDAEFLDRLMRLHDLIPRRRITLALLLMVGTAVIVGFETAYAWMLNWVARGNHAVTTLDLAVKGSLGCWLSTLFLLAASLFSVMIYGIRRHRIDDYQGRYRIWLWAAACWFFMAADQAASLREAFREVMLASTGTPLLGSGDLWWASCYAVILGALLSRLLLDMRECPIALAAMVLAISGVVLSMLGRLDWISAVSAKNQTMFIAGAEMSSGLMLTIANMIFARHVLFDAEGLLPRREKMAEDEPLEAMDSTSRPSSWRSVDPPHGLPQRSSPHSSAVLSSQTFAPAPPASPSSLNRKLTKGEKKALKERLLRERMERQRKLG